MQPPSLHTTRQPYLRTLMGFNAARKEGPCASSAVAFSAAALAFAAFMARIAFFGCSPTPPPDVHATCDQTCMPHACEMHATCTRHARGMPATLPSSLAHAHARRHMQIHQRREHQHAHHSPFSVYDHWEHQSVLTLIVENRIFGDDGALSGNVRLGLPLLTHGSPRIRRQHRCPRLPRFPIFCHMHVCEERGKRARSHARVCAGARCNGQRGRCAEGTHARSHRLRMQCRRSMRTGDSSSSTLLCFLCLPRCPLARALLAWTSSM
jgi:hypothetical protein